MLIPEGRPTSHMVLIATSAISNALTMLYSQLPVSATLEATNPDACRPPL
jgi:hypothetical protein